jgi:hypothetical protein
MPRRATLITVVVALAGALAAPATAAAAASSPVLPRVTISPLNGTPDASPTTQISFLGVPAGDLSSIVVRGSRSGGHGGRLEPYAAGGGASFVPLRAFTIGETVTVNATVAVSGQHESVGTHFTVGSLVAVPAAAPPAPTPPAPAGTVASFVTQPTFHPPTVSVTTPAADPALGDIFLTPTKGPSQSGPMIVGPAGQLVWFSPEPAGTTATDLRVQQYLGRPVLTYWQGRVVLGHGVGSGVIDNTSYQQLAQVHAGNGLQMDLHDFDLEPNGVAYITVYQPVRWNLSSVHGPTNGIINDCIVQEIDVRTGLVMFEWHALGHVPLTASYSAPRPSSTAYWDWFHIDSIDVESDDNLLISSRNTWTVYQIGHSYGEILWRLGGRYSSFKLGPNVHFAWQHNALKLNDGSIEIFDNEDTPRIAPASRGIDVNLNFTDHTATLLHQYVNPKQTVLAASQGDVQPLSNSDHLVGWGQIGLVSEISAAGALTFQLSLPGPVQSYRAYRFPGPPPRQGHPRSRRRVRVAPPPRRSPRAGTVRPQSLNGRCSRVRRRPLSRRSAAPCPAQGSRHRSTPQRPRRTSP